MNRAFVDLRARWLAPSALCILALAVNLAALPSYAEEPDALSAGTKAFYRGQYEEARRQSGRYLETHPRSTAAYILRGRVEMAAGKYDPAYAAFRKALASDPTNIDALYYLEELCAILSQGEFRRLLETAPDSVRAHQLMADTYLSQNRREDAERELQAALRGNPKSVEILDALGDLMRIEYKFAVAREYYARASQLEPRDYASAYGLGACDLFERNPGRAIENLRRAVAIDSASAVAHFALGDALLRIDQPAEAVTHLQNAVALRPTMRETYALLARAYQKLGRASEAQQALQKEQRLYRQQTQLRNSLVNQEKDDRPEEFLPDQEEPTAPQP